MRYIKGETALPRELLEQIQQYVDGVYLYIPRKREEKRPWGSATAYRAELRQRNRAICQAHRAGRTPAELAQEYHLAVKTIHRILRETE